MTLRLPGALLAAGLLILITCVPAVSDTVPGDDARAVALLAGLPVSFVQNAGQFDNSVVFSADCNGDRLYFLRDRVILATPATGGTDYQVSLSFGGSDPAPEIRGTDPLPGRANYLVGNDPGSWHTGIQTYGGVAYRGLYTGIDLSYRGTAGTLKREFLVSPGADPSVIALNYEGVDRIALLPDGTLLISTPAGALVESPPVCYQEVSGTRTEVAGAYRLTGDHTAGFSLGPYDPSYPLVIDPALNFSSYLGGNGDESPATATFVTQIPVSGIGVAVDGTGMVYVTGTTKSNNFPTVSARNYSQIGWDDVFVSKLDPVNRTIVYSTYLGGTLNDESFGITVNSRGEATVTGLTDSRNFPVVNTNKTNLSCSGVPDVFVSRLNAVGDNLTYSTYYGGCATDIGRAISQIDDDTVVVTGWTGSRTNISSPGAFQEHIANPQWDDAFVAVFDATGNTSPVATYLGGTDTDRGYAVTFDNASKQVYLTGFTESIDFPTMSPLQGKNNGDVDAFISIFDRNLTALNFSSYLGGDGKDVGFGIAIDPQSNAYLTGSTSSGGATFFRVKFPVFPISTAYQRSLLGVQDAFVTKIRPPGASPAGFVYSTYLGGSTSGPAGVLNGASQGQAIIVNNESNATVIGTTDNRDFPL
ncbi:MAG: SBBP repeat-containing protein, partial [Methanoregulaceae archaeon]|nr:SBBP repeat-containing protein [Methanoregulaceae archaeon]